MRHIIILLLVLSIALSGCSNESMGTVTGGVVVELEPNCEPPRICSETEQPKEGVVTVDAEQTKEEAVVEAQKEEARFISDKEYTIEDAHKDLKELLDAGFGLIEEEENPNYYFLGSSKLAAIEIHEDLDTPSEFCKKDCANFWEGQYAFVNKTYISWLFPPLKESDFDNQLKYRNYELYSQNVNLAITEKEIELENGKVLEYNYMPWVTNENGYFQYAWVETLFMYKIYCSPNMTILIRPKWQNLMIGERGSDLETASKNWESDLAPEKEKLLKAANEILARCPVEKEFFDDYNFPHYESSKLMKFHLDTWYDYYYNFTADITPIIATGSRYGEDIYLLKSINTTVVNLRYSEWNPLEVQVSVSADDKGYKEYYTGTYVGLFKINQEKEKNIKGRSISYNDFEFKDKLDIKIQFKLANWGMTNIGREFVITTTRDEKPDLNSTYNYKMFFTMNKCPKNQCYKLTKLE